jgi:hypothetical protein
MSEKSIAQKLVVRPGYRVAVVNAPNSVAAIISELSADASVDAEVGAADAVLLFVADTTELARFWPRVSSAFPADATLWIAYPKRTSSVPTDLSRDNGWEPVIDGGLDAVSQVSLDDTWSALRFRRDPVLRAQRAARGRPGPGHRPTP